MIIKIDKKVERYMLECAYNSDGQCKKKCVRCKKPECTECIKKPKYKCTKRCVDVQEYRNNLLIFSDKLKK